MRATSEQRCSLGQTGESLVRAASERWCPLGQAEGAQCALRRKLVVRWMKLGELSERWSGKVSRQKVIWLGTCILRRNSFSAGWALGIGMRPTSDCTPRRVCCRWNYAPYGGTYSW